MKLTKAQWNFLIEAHRWTGHPEAAGTGARRGAQERMADGLARLGLVTFVGVGSSLDYDSDQEWPIYSITEKGRALLSESPDPPESS